MSVDFKYLSGGSKTLWKFDESLGIHDLFWTDSRRRGLKKFEPLQLPSELDMSATSAITKDERMLKTILNYLPDNDLRNAGSVTADWKKTAEELRNERYDLYWMFWGCYSNLSLSNFIQHFVKRRMFSTPKCCIIFVYYAHHVHVLRHLFPHLDPKCSVLYVPNSPRVIGSVHTEENGVQDIEKCLPAFCALSIPDIPGVNATKFSFTREQYDSLPNMMLRWGKIDQTIGITENVTVKGIIFFLTEGFEQHICMYRLLSFLQEERKDKIPAVGIVNRVVPTHFYKSSETGYNYSKEANHDIVFSGLIFHGENVRASSVVMSNEESLPDLLEDMKRKSVLGDQNIALMFSQETEKWHERYTAESRCFHSCFPGVPLIGQLGVTTMGVTSFSRQDTDESQGFQEAASTVLMLSFDIPSDSSKMVNNLVDSL